MKVDIDAETAEVAEMIRASGNRPEDVIMKADAIVRREGVHTPVNGSED